MRYDLKSAKPGEPLLGKHRTSFGSLFKGGRCPLAHRATAHHSPGPFCRPAVGRQAGRKQENVGFKKL
jgi:hypothetical protein